MEEKEIEKLWAIYYPKIYGYYIKRVQNREDVEDLTSITMQGLLSTLLDEEKSNRISNPEAYAWKIAHNQLVHFIDRKSKLPVTVGLNDDTSSIDRLTDSKYTSNWNDKLLCIQSCALKTLKEQDFEIVKLSIIEDMQSKEISSLLGLTAETVRQRLSRSLKKLRKDCYDIWQVCKE